MMISSFCSAPHDKKDNNVEGSSVGNPVHREFEQKTTHHVEFSTCPPLDGSICLSPQETEFNEQCARPYRHEPPPEFSLKGKGSPSFESLHCCSHGKISRSRWVARLILTHFTLRACCLPEKWWPFLRLPLQNRDMSSRHCHGKPIPYHRKLTSQKK